jgi:hypothetical protein
MTREKFDIYNEVRRSGKTNMLDVKSVIRLSGYKLDREDVMDIIQNYGGYQEIWPEEAQ